VSGVRRFGAGEGGGSVLSKKERNMAYTAYTSQTSSGSSSYAVSVTIVATIDVNERRPDLRGESRVSGGE